MLDYEAVRFLWRPNEDFEWRYSSVKMAWEFGEILIGPQFDWPHFYPIMTILDDFIEHIEPTIQHLPYQQALNTATKWISQRARMASL